MEEQQLLFDIHILETKKEENLKRKHFLELTIKEIDKRLINRWYKKKVDSITLGYLRSERIKCLKEISHLEKENKNLDKKLLKITSKLHIEDDSELKRA